MGVAIVPDGNPKKVGAYELSIPNLERSVTPVLPPMSKQIEAVQFVKGVK